MIKAIIFDCFGVLTQDGWTTFVQRYATPETQSELSDLNSAVDKGLIGFEDFFAKVASLVGISAAEVYTLLVRSYHPNVDVFKLIDALKANYQISIISNISSPLTDYLPAECFAAFEYQTLSYQVKVSKPSPEIFQKHLELIAAEPSEAVFIDDRESNCEGARAVGMHAILFKGAKQLQADLRALGVTFGQ